jgi:hypothetical protein
MELAVTWAFAPLKFEVNTHAYHEGSWADQVLTTRKLRRSGNDLITYKHRPKAPAAYVTMSKREPLSDMIVTALNIPDHKSSERDTRSSRPTESQ